MATVKKYQAGGVASKKKKAPMVDPKGAYTKVQERTLGNMKKGGSIKKAQSGEKVKGTMIGRASRNSEYSVDTTGYAAGKKDFPATIKTTVGTKDKRELPETKGIASRSMVKTFLKGKPVVGANRQKNGGKVKKK
jgi:hypothetical protein